MIRTKKRQNQKQRIDLARRASRLSNYTLQCSFFFFARMSCSEQITFHGQASDRVWFFSELLFQITAKTKNLFRAQGGKGVLSTAATCASLSSPWRFRMSACGANAHQRCQALPCFFPGPRHSTLRVSSTFDIRTIQKTVIPDGGKFYARRPGEWAVSQSV